MTLKSDSKGFLIYLLKIKIFTKVQLTLITFMDSLRNNLGPVVVLFLVFLLPSSTESFIVANLVKISLVK